MLLLRETDDGQWKDLGPLVCLFVELFANSAPGSFRALLLYWRVNASLLFACVFLLCTCCVLHHFSFAAQLMIRYVFIFLAECFLLALRSAFFLTTFNYVSWVCINSMPAVAKYCAIGSCTVLLHTQREIPEPFLTSQRAVLRTSRKGWKACNDIMMHLCRTRKI